MDEYLESLDRTRRNWLNSFDSRLLAASAALTVLLAHQEPYYLREREVVYCTSSPRHPGDEGQNRTNRPLIPLDRVSPEVRELVQRAYEFRDELFDWLVSDQPGDGNGLEEEIFRPRPTNKGD